MQPLNTYKQYRETRTTLAYKRERLVIPRTDGTFVYFRVVLKERGPEFLEFVLGSPVLAETAYVFYLQKTYRITERDLRKNYFHAPSRRIILPRVSLAKVVEPEPLEVDQEIESLLEDWSVVESERT